MIGHLDAESIDLCGLVHRLTVSRTDADGDRYLVLVDVAPTGSALLDREDIEALIEWLSGVVADTDADADHDMPTENWICPRCNRELPAQVWVCDCAPYPQSTEQEDQA